MKSSAKSERETVHTGAKQGLRPCSECGSTRADRFETPGVFSYDPPTAQCYDLVGCKRRWKAKQRREIVEACAAGRHAGYARGACLDCGAPDPEQVED